MSLAIATMAVNHPLWFASTLISQIATKATAGTEHDNLHASALAFAANYVGRYLATVQATRSTQPSLAISRADVASGHVYAFSVPLNRIRNVAHRPALRHDGRQCGGLCAIERFRLSAYFVPYFAFRRSDRVWPNRTLRIMTNPAVQQPLRSLPITRLPTYCQRYSRGS